MRLYNCGGANQSFQCSPTDNYSQPITFDFDNYRIKWDPQVEEYVDRLQQASNNKRIVADDYEDDDDEYYWDVDDYDDDPSVQLSHLSLKPSPLQNNFKY